MTVDLLQKQEHATKRRVARLLSIVALLAATTWCSAVVALFVTYAHGKGFRLGQNFPQFQDIGIYNTRFTLFHTEAFYRDLPGYSSFAYPPVDALLYAYLYSVSKPVTDFVVLMGLWMVLFCGVAAHVLRGCTLSIWTRLAAALALPFFSFPVVFLAERANVEFFVWVLISLGTYLYVRRRLPWAAACFGLAAGMKLYPILLLGIFVRDRREIKAALLGVATFVLSTLAALWYAGPTIAIAFHGFLNGVLHFKNANGERSRTVEIPFDHSLFSPIKVAGLSGHVLPTHWAQTYYLVAGFLFVGLFLFAVRKKPLLNRLMFLSVAMVALPPVSYEYTLVHLYLPIVLLLAYVLHRSVQTDERLVSADLVALGAALLLTFPFGILGNGTFVLAGQIKVLALLMLAGVAALHAWHFEVALPGLPATGAFRVLSPVRFAGATSAVLPQTVRERAEATSLSSGPSLLLHGLTLLGDALESKPWICFVVMLTCYVPVVLLQAHSKLLINDELYTVHIAQQPTLGRMLWMAREIDLHPPLHYLLQRWALHLPMPRWLDARLPSMLAGWFVTLSVYLIARRRMGNLMGLLAACVFWFTPALDFAWVNRPYELWLGFLFLMLLVRDVAHQSKRPSWCVPLIFLLTLCMVMTHLLGIACLAIVAAAEWWRSRRTGVLDKALLSALLLPALVGLGFYYQFHHLSQNAFPEAQQPSWELLTVMYIALFGNAAAIIGGCTLGFAMLFGKRVPQIQSDLDLERASRRFSSDDLLLLTMLLLLPVGLFLPALLLNLQFWFRYAGASMPAMALLATWFVARKLPLPRALATLVIVCAVSYMAYVAIIDTPPQTNALSQSGGHYPISLESLPKGVPIVAASPMTFIEMADREPLDVSSRTFYLTDRDAALRYAHYTLFENEDKINRLLNLPTKTESLRPFLLAHRQFFVLGDFNRPEVWLLRKLDADGDQVVYLGKFISSYETEDLYMVTVKQKS